MIQAEVWVKPRTRNVPHVPPLCFFRGELKHLPNPGDWIHVDTGENGEATAQVLRVHHHVSQAGHHVSVQVDEPDGWTFWCRYVESHQPGGQA